MFACPTARTRALAGPGLRRGLSLLEVVAASALLAATLVPALRILRDALSLSRSNETRSLLTTLCVSTMEQHLPLSADSWTTSTVSGNFSADGYSAVKFQVVRSDSSGSGGIPDKLMAITVTVWEDANSDATVNTGELSVVMATKVAKLSLYQALP
jgi:hypothetical protein